MKKNRRGKGGFSIIELVIAMGISFLLILVLYYAYYLAQTFFKMGSDTILEQTYVRNLFAKIGEDLQFVNRLNYLSGNYDELEFEIFNRKVLSMAEGTSNKIVEGNTIFYSVKSSKDGKYLLLTKRADSYKWLMVFGHSQKPNDDDDPKGYPDDMRNPLSGKEETATGDEKEVVEQAEGDEFLLTRIQFIPFDQDGKKIEAEGDLGYKEMQPARSMRVELEYMVKGNYGDTAKLATRKKTATANILFISFAMQTLVTEEAKFNNFHGISNFYCLAELPLTAVRAGTRYFSPDMQLTDPIKLKVITN